MSNEHPSYPCANILNIAERARRALTYLGRMSAAAVVPASYSFPEAGCTLPRTDDELQENALVNIKGESIRMNRDLGVTEFGTVTRLVFESQWAIRFADGSYVQFGADIYNDHKIFEILRAPAGVQRIYTGNIRSCGVAEIPIGADMMLLHGFDSQNLERLLDYGMHLLGDGGTTPVRMGVIRLHTQNHWNYKRSLEEYCAARGLCPQITYVDKAVPIQKQVPGTVVV